MAQRYGLLLRERRGVVYLQRGLWIDGDVHYAIEGGWGRRPLVPQRLSDRRNTSELAGS